MKRRDFFMWTAAAAVGGGTATHVARPHAGAPRCAPPAFSVVPVVGDGKWIWNQPPANETGYLEPRPFKAQIGIELTGLGNAWQIASTTPVPVACPEQKIVSERIVTVGCQAEIQQLTPDSRVLCLYCPQMVKGQKVSAIVHYELTLYKQFHAFHRDQFPEKQSIPLDVQRSFMGESPGIQTRSKEVKELLATLNQGLSHPWDLAHKFVTWIRQNIRPQIGSYTSVPAALQTRRGDCEEMSAVFVALCRAASIPARLVWIPNHNWAEFYLTDREDLGHWLPAHTACYFWFGWTGAHELVLQKGDRIRPPQRHTTLRLVEDWLQSGGRKPQPRYLGELTPEPPGTGGDAGPGARQKTASGEWKPVGTHPLDRYARF